MYNNWSPRQIVDDSERARLAEPNKRPAPNPPALLALVPVRVLRPFYVDGRPVEVGETVKVQECLARDLVALKRAERVEVLGVAAAVQRK